MDEAGRILSEPIDLFGGVDPGAWPRQNEPGYTPPVSPAAFRLYEAAMKLSDSDRAELLALLIDSEGDGSSQEEIDASWIAEAKRRLEDIRAGRSETVPYQEVVSKARALIEQARRARRAG